MIPTRISLPGRFHLVKDLETHLVLPDSCLEVLVALRVLIVSPDKHAILPRRYGKRPNASHDISDNLAGLE